MKKWIRVGLLNLALVCGLSAVVGAEGAASFFSSNASVPDAKEVAESLKDTQSKAKDLQSVLKKKSHTWAQVHQASLELHQSYVDAMEQVAAVQLGISRKQDKGYDDAANIKVLMKRAKALMSTSKKAIQAKDVDALIAATDEMRHHAATMLMIDTNGQRTAHQNYKKLASNLEQGARNTRDLASLDDADWDVLARQYKAMNNQCMQCHASFKKRRR